MMFDLASTNDLTARAIHVRDEKLRREETRVIDRPSREFEETVFFVYPADVPSMRRSGTLTPTGAELATARQITRTPVQTGVQEHVVDSARDARVTLLARKYEGLSSLEDDARLAILTARLRKLSPRVTSVDIDNLTAMVSELEHVSSNLEAIRTKFGLK